MTPTATPTDTPTPTPTPTATATATPSNGTELERVYELHGGKDNYLRKRLLGII